MQNLKQITELWFHGSPVDYVITTAVILRTIYSIFSTGSACHSEEEMFCLNGASLWSCAQHVQQYYCPQSQYTTSIPVTRARWSRPSWILCNCRKPFGEYTVYPKYRGDCLTIPIFQAYVWDLMMFMPDEYRILRRSRFSVPTVAYLLSRSVVQHSRPFLLLKFEYSVGTLGSCIGETVFQGGRGAWSITWTNHLIHWIVAPVADCKTIDYIVESLYILSLSSTSLLFFSRVRAVYGNSKIITIFFGLMWASTVGMSTLILVSVDTEVSLSVLLSICQCGAKTLIFSRGTYPAHWSDK